MLIGQEAAAAAVKRNGNGSNGAAACNNNGYRTLRPMDYLSSQKRKHSVLVLLLLCIFLVSVLACYAVIMIQTHPAGVAGGSQLQQQQSTTTSSSSSTLFREKQQQMAQEALERLNSHAHHDNIQEGCESTLLVMRHCDKLGSEVEDKAGNKHCSYLGYQRAAFLRTLFGNATDVSSRWPSPSRLYALWRDTGSITHTNYREWETLVPLSKKTGVNIEVVDGENANKFASEHYFQHLQSGELCGKVAVVCWRHSLIPELANALGCGPDNGCPGAYPEDSFDQVWQIKYVFHPTPIRLDNPDGDTFGNDTTKKDAPNHSDRRRMKHRHHHGKDRQRGWAVYAALTNQFFDPLAFSKASGDYPDGGTAYGGRWQDEL